MNLFAKLAEREKAGRPLQVGLIGAGKFGSMYLAQVRRTPGVCLAMVADLDPERARGALHRTGWSGTELAEVRFVDDARALIEDRTVEIVIDATGSPSAGIAHVLACCEARKHIVMVNVEADALAGPLLAQRARQAGIVYSLAYGDQPSLICEMVDWGRAASRSSLPARARSICPNTTLRRQTPFGLITDFRRRRSRPAASMPRCSIRFSTAPRAPSKCAQWPTRPDWPRRTASRFRLAVSTISRVCCGHEPRVDRSLSAARSR